MKAGIIKMIGLGLVSLIVLLWDDFYTLAVIYFYFLSAYLFIDIYKFREIKLVHVWCAGFLYIILSEAFLTPEVGRNLYGLDALQYLIISNNLILMGYYSGKREKSETQKPLSYQIKNAGLVVIVFLIVVFVAATITTALNSFQLGRQAANEDQDSFVLESIIESLGFILPSISVFYFIKLKKTGFLVPFLLSFPIFLILFMQGSRFPLLFTVLGFFITYQRLNALGIGKIKFSFKTALLMAVVGGVLTYSSIKMKEFRIGADAYKYDTPPLANDDLPSNVSQYFSQEGVIDMTSLMFSHFSREDFLYGKSSSFILYFWVPRSVWPEKPTMLGHWFVRRYRTGFASGHSTSFGFSGDFYADFGYFSYIVMFILGRLLYRLQKFKDLVLKSGNYSMILGAMSYPYVFFFLRSPITATMTFLGILAFYFLIKKVILTETIPSA